MARLAKYNPKEVIAFWNGVLLNEGIADGTFFELDRFDRTYKRKVGVDGEPARGRTNDFGGFLRFSLLASAPTNSALTPLIIADELTGVIVGPFLLTDFNGGGLYSSPLAYIEGWPLESFGTDETIKEYVLICEPLIPLPQGREELTGG